MVTEIKDLKDKVVNVTMQGIVRRKSNLLPLKSNGNYFTFYMFDEDGNKVRAVAYKDAASKLFPELEQGKMYKVTEVSVRENIHLGNKEMQITLTTNTGIEEVKCQTVLSPSYTDITNIKKCSESIDIIGRVMSIKEGERILRTGENKAISILTLMDCSGYIDVTFWDQTDTVRNISTNSVIVIEGATVILYKGELSLNVGKFAEITINPSIEFDKKLELLPENSILINMSQRSESLNISSQSYPTPLIISTIKRKLEKIKEKEEKLKIKKFIFKDMLARYENN